MIEADAPGILDAGDLVWVDLRPTIGREQTGVRPALVLTDRAFHERSATAIIYPITRNRNPWPTKIMLPAGLAVAGAVLTDQIRCVDRSGRGFRHIGRVPPLTLDEVRRKIANVLGIPHADQDSAP